MLTRSGFSATRWIEQRGQDADDETSYPLEPAYLVLARVLLATDAADRALHLLARLQADAGAHGRTGSLIEIQALRARALAAGGDETRAVAALAEALTLACSQGYLRVFADEGPAMGALLGRLIATQPRRQAAANGDLPVDYLSRLVREARHPHPRQTRCGRNHEIDLGVAARLGEHQRHDRTTDRGR